MKESASYCMLIHNQEKDIEKSYRVANIQSRGLMETMLYNYYHLYRIFNIIKKVS